MKLDKNTIDMITRMSDENLWRIICALGVSSGIDLSGVTVGPKEMQNVRKALSQMTDDDISRAIEIVENCKRGGTNDKR